MFGACIVGTFVGVLFLFPFFFFFDCSLVDSQRCVNFRNIECDSVMYVCVCSLVSDSLQTHRLEPARFPRPWDFPGKNTGVGCHFLL